MHLIASSADLVPLLSAPLAVLYKHSPICAASGVAYEEILAFRRRSAVPVYLVDVVKHRPLSRTLAERTGVRHESPQVIVLREGVAAWHGSHYDIQADALARVVTEVGQADGRTG